MKMSRAAQPLLKDIKIGSSVFFKTQKNGKRTFDYKNQNEKNNPLSAKRHKSRWYYFHKKLRKMGKKDLITKIKMSRASHSPLKVIKIGSTVFFKTQKNRKEYLGKICYKNSTN